MKSGQEFKAGTWEQELKRKSWKNTASWLALHGLPNLSYITQDHLSGGGTVCSELCPPSSVINQENALQAYLQAHLMETLSPLRFFFPDDSTLCEANIKLANIATVTTLIRSNDFQLVAISPPQGTLDNN